jgi:ribonuclease Z
MKIQITFLGTSQAVPTETRNHTSILLNYKDENILVDCGEGTQRQFRKAKINPCKLTRLLITHWHGDHVLGIPGLLQTLALNNYSKTLNVYGPKGTKKFMTELYKIFVPVGKVKINVNEISSGKIVSSDDFEIFTLPLEHDTPTNGYCFIEKDKLRIDKDKLKKLKLPNIPEVGKLTQGKDIKIDGKTIKSKDITYHQKGRKISFILDTKICSNVKKLAKESDLAIIESTYSDEDKDKASEYKHMTAKQAAESAKSSDVKELILTHLSQRYEHKEDKILKEAKAVFKNTRLAEDFIKLEI